MTPPDHNDLLPEYGFRRMRGVVRGKYALNPLARRQAVGLAIEVGGLAWMLANDEDEGAEYTRNELQRINEVLKREGLPPHFEPETLPEFPNRGQAGSFPYGYLHHLRRALAYARQAPTEFATIDLDADPSRDLQVDRELSVVMDSHIICHSDGDGYYVPIDFQDIIYPQSDEDIPGGMLGSSYRVRDELVAVAPLIGIDLKDGILHNDEAAKLAEYQDSHRCKIERLVWFSFYEAARISIEYKTAIRFS